MEEIISWISNNCPLIWSILNEQAKKSLPDGITEFLNSGSECEIHTGRFLFLEIEKNVNQLSQKIIFSEISDKYRRDLSSVSTEQQLSELFAEIAVCSTISKIADNISLKPKTQDGKSTDFRAFISNNEIVGEVKRYEDNWLIKKKSSSQNIIKGRSIISSEDESIKQKTIIPRYIELFNKIKEVNKQLSANAINLIFLFHSSIGETEGYLKQVLFGENNFFLPSKEIVLETNSLYSKKEWNNVSALFLCKFGNSGFVDFYEVFINPNAITTLSEDVLNKIKGA